MAEKDRDPQEQDGPSLELPSFGFGRKKKARPAKAEPQPEPAPVAEPVVEEQPTAPQPVGPGAPLFVEDAPPPAVDTDPDSDPEPESDDDGDRKPSRPWSVAAVPQLGAVPAALVTGVLVGVITVGLVWLSFRLCEVIGGTSSCGNPGFLVLLAIFVIAALLGGQLLAAFGVSDGTSTSFLAMGVVAVVMLMVPGSVLFAWWMVIAVPVVAMPAYVLAHRLTTAMVEPTGREMHR